MNWFIFTCKSAGEEKAAAELRVLDMDVLLPMGKRYVRRVKGKSISQEVIYPLWTGYVVGGAVNVDWPALHRRFDNEHFSLIGPILIDGEVRPIGPALVEEIRNRSWIQLKPFDEGDEVRIQKGPFREHTGKILDLTDSSAELVLTILGKSVRASFDPSILEATDE